MLSDNGQGKVRNRDPRIDAYASTTRTRPATHNTIPLYRECHPEGRLSPTDIYTPCCAQRINAYKLCARTYNVNELVSALRQFITRDLMYILGGSCALSSLLLLLDVSNPLLGSLSTAGAFLWVGVAYITGFSIQETLSLTPLFTRIIKHLVRTIRLAPILETAYNYIT